MTNTQNYGFSLPQGWDGPDRGALAGNLQKLDGALAALNRGAAGLQGNLETMGYNLYNLTLQDYYDGKQTGYKKNLILDGFADGGLVESLSNGLTVDVPGRRLFLDAVGQQGVERGYASGYADSLQPGASISFQWTATGNGTLTALSLCITGKARVTVSEGAASLWQTAMTAEADWPTLSCSVPVSTGRTYTITIVNIGTGRMGYCGKSASLCPGYKLAFTPAAATSGTMVSVSFPLTGAATRAAAWVRHSGGTVNLSVRLGSGAWFNFARTGARVIVNQAGTPCTETAFTTSRALSGNLQLRLALSTTAGTSIRVFDYGLVLF